MLSCWEPRAVEELGGSPGKSTRQKKTGVEGGGQALAGLPLSTSTASIKQPEKGSPGLRGEPNASQEGPSSPLLSPCTDVLSPQPPAGAGLNQHFGNEPVPAAAKGR